MLSLLLSLVHCVLRLRGRAPVMSFLQEKNQRDRRASKIPGSRIFICSSGASHISTSFKIHDQWSLLVGVLKINVNTYVAHTFVVKPAGVLFQGVLYFFRPLILLPHLNGIQHRDRTLLTRSYSIFEGW